MTPAADLVPSSNRLEYFRGLRARLDPSGDPADAMSDFYIAVPGAVSSRIAAELSLAPKSTHLLIGGVGSGKSTELLATQRLVSEIDDVRALYIDVSKQHDIAKMVPGAVIAQVGLALGAALQGVAGAEEPAKLARDIAHGYWKGVESPDEGDPGFHVPGILVSPELVAENVERALGPLQGLLQVLRGTTAHLVVLLDGLDRMTDMPAFERLVLHDLKTLTAIGVGVVLAGPLRALYGVNRTVTERFDSFHYQPWIDVFRGREEREFLASVLRKRVLDDALSEDGIDMLIFGSGGVLRDLLTLAQS